LYVSIKGHIIHVRPDLTYMNATLKQQPHATNHSPGSEKKENHGRIPARTLKIGTRKSDADSIGMKQVPREPGCDTSSQPASEDGVWDIFGVLQSMAPAEV
jgi:hypothetical protein